MILAVPVFFAVFTVFLSLIIDAVLGEYPSRLHPVVIIGKSIEKLEGYFNKLKEPYLAGILFVVAVEAMFVIILGMMLALASRSVIVLLVISALLLKSTFSVKGMASHVNPIISALKTNDLDGARASLAKVVRRSTAELSPELICSATIETISEGLVDAFISPLFYFSFFGVIGAFFYRIANTFDSMIGYRNSRYIKFGKFASLLDTLLNYVPARISSFVIYTSSSVLRLRPISYDAPRAASSTASANAGWPMGSFSNCLGVRLEKKGEYVINDNYREPTISDIEVSMKLYRYSSYIYVIVFVLPVLFFIYIL